MEAFTEVPLLLAAANFSGYTVQTAGLSNQDVARVMAGYYELAGAMIRAAGGRVVKFIGDGLLAVFPADGVDRGVEGLLGLKDAADRYMADRHWACRLAVKAHFGTVAQGEFGAGADRRSDVLGREVNALFRLEPNGEFTLSAAAEARLGPALRARLAIPSRLV